MGLVARPRGVRIIGRGRLFGWLGTVRSVGLFAFGWCVMFRVFNYECLFIASLVFSDPRGSFHVELDSPGIGGRGYREVACALSSLVMSVQMSIAVVSCLSFTDHYKRSNWGLFRG